LVAVWHITETEDALFNTIVLADNDREALKAFALPKRRLERLACRQILAFLLHTDKIELAYSETGAPLLKNGFVSFSHSGKYAAAAFSPTTPIGIDIEKVDDRIDRLYPRFMPLKSPLLSKEKDIPHFSTYIWCAKEAAYKLYAQANLDFVQDITIEAKLQQGNVALPQGGSLSFSIFHYIIENMMLCVTIERRLN